MAIRDRRTWGEYLTDGARFWESDGARAYRKVRHGLNVNSGEIAENVAERLEGQMVDRHSAVFGARMERDFMREMQLSEKGLFGSSKLGWMYENAIEKPLGAAKGAGKLLLLGGAAAGITALALGMFGGSKKKEESVDVNKEFADAQDPGIPSPDAMVRVPAGPESLLPPGVVPTPGSMTNAVRPNGPLSLTELSNRDVGSPIMNMGG